MTLKMSEGGEKVAVVEAPTYIVTSRSTEVSGVSASKGIQKKHMLIGVGLVILSGLIIGGILGGMYIFADAQKEIIKFAVNFKSSTDGKDVKQEVESDPNDNVVIYRITKDGKDIQIAYDFNRELQVVKMQSNSGVNCYVSPLNRSAVLDPSQISETESDENSDKKNGGSTVFTVSTSPVSDRSFLPKKALDMCKTVSLYWAFRSCNGQDVNQPTMSNTTSPDERQRRGLYYAGTYKGLPCLNGCCYTICSCSVQIIEVRIGTKLTCLYYNHCPTGYYYRSYQKTPGVIC